MILTGWATAAALLIPGIGGAALALVLGQLQMLVDCCDGEVARWRGTSSPAGIFLDNVGHYTTETLIAIALGVRAAGYPFDTPADFLWTNLGTLLALVIVLNKALNDMVRVARANAGLAKLADTQSEYAPTHGLIASLRRAARFLPFHRLYHSVELTIAIFVFSVVGLFIGATLADRILLVGPRAALGARADRSFRDDHGLAACSWLTRASRSWCSRRAPGRMSCAGASTPSSHSAE